MANGTYGQGEGTLSAAAQMVRDAKGDFDKIASRLTSQIADVQGKWGGDGARAFFALHTAWDEKQRTIVAALDQFAESLGTTEKINVTTDQTQGSTLSKLQQRL